MNRDDVTAYLDRIGMESPGAPSAELLRELQVRHLSTVPFENLSIHLGEPIRLDEAALLDKIVRRRRGGFCYELNGAFAALLRALGFEVSLLAVSVYDGDTLGPPLDHLALRVDVDGASWLVDVGFGRHAHHPLRLDTDEPQPDPDGGYVVRPVVHPDATAVDVLREGVPRYRAELLPRRLTDFVPLCWWQQTSPESHFTQGFTCSMLTAGGGRVTISGNRLITSDGDDRAERELADDAEILRAYRTHFDVRLSRVPTLVGVPAEA